MTTTRSHGPRYDLVPPAPTKIDGPTMWARMNAPFKDSGYQELMARERNRERQRLDRIRARQWPTIACTWVAAVALCILISIVW